MPAIPLHSVLRVLPALAIMAATGAARAQPQSPPCAACVLLALDPGQALILCKK